MFTTGTINILVGITDVTSQRFDIFLCSSTEVGMFADFTSVYNLPRGLLIGLNLILLLELLLLAECCPFLCIRHFQSMAVLRASSF